MESFYGARFSATTNAHRTSCPRAEERFTTRTQGFVVRMKQTLQLRLGQQLTMTPQLQQAIRLLQLSTLDLQAEVQELVETNPLLEVADNDEADSSDSDWAETAGEPGEEVVSDAIIADAQLTTQTVEAAPVVESPVEESRATEAADTEIRDIPEELPVDSSWDDIYDVSTVTSSSSGSEFDGVPIDSQGAAADTLRDHLSWQLRLTLFSEVDRTVAEAIVDAIGEDGYLSVPLDSLWESLRERFPELELDEVEAVLRRIQSFDPLGVGARDLRECLLLQLQRVKDQSALIELAKHLVRDHLELLGNRDFPQLMRRLKISKEELQQVVGVIQSLNPRPCASIAPAKTEYVVPDVIVRKDRGAWRVDLNPDTVPKLRINSTYASLIRRADNSTDNVFLKNNLQEARWFIKSLQSRNETLLKVARCIVERQRAFLEYGDEAMKALVLHDVAESVGMHESTISRVTSQKYMHTPRGIFELKYFFSSHVATAAGGECSSTAIRALIKKLIAAETPDKPLSDSKIASVLCDQGIIVARRTVAKYREAMAIPPSNERRRLT